MELLKVLVWTEMKTSNLPIKKKGVGSKQLFLAHLLR